MIDYSRIKKGDRVITNANMAAWSTNGYYSNINANILGRVSRVGRFKSLIRFNGTASYWIDNVFLDRANDTIAKKASDGEIAIDDPRIDWIWRMVADYANRVGYCNEFDSICEELGIPGREREFNVQHTIGGYAVRSRVTARSQVEADAKFKEALDARQ